MSTVSMSWIERIAGARERGHFAPEDFAAWRCCHTCFIGEVTARMVEPLLDLQYDPHFYGYVQDTVEAQTGRNLQTRIYVALLNNDFDTAEWLLGVIEDAALIVKREGSYRAL